MYISKTNKFAIYITLLLGSALLALNEWSMYLDKKEKRNAPQVYEQCANPYVMRTPHACNEGELIFVDASVADKYCTDVVFARTEQNVYCVYNGKRDDRDRQIKRFKRRDN